MNYAISSLILTLRHIDLCLRLDDEDGVRIGVAGGAEFLAGIVEGLGEDGIDDAAVSAADEIKTTFLLDELELVGHASVIRSVIGSIHRIAGRINRKVEAGDGNL
jgi:hypothetical protein